MGAKTPQHYAQWAEEHATLPPGHGDRLAGYALMGLPFSSGNYLAYRRFPQSSFGPGYSSVWLRRPDGAWTFYADAAPGLSCARFFGAALSGAVRTPVAGNWTGPNRLSVSVPGVLDWELELKSTPATMLLSAMAGAMPQSLWRSDPLLGAMGKVMGPVLRSGRMGLSGLVPNGQSFRARPLRVWLVEASTATVDGSDAGTPRPLPVQEHLGDAWLPQRGVFVADTSLVFPSTEQPAAVE